MMTLYHGSYLSINQPLIDKGRKNLDFGQGFYLTILQGQAVRWAKAIAERKGPKAEAVLNIYAFDYEKAVSEARYKRFDNYDLEWLNYVVACRRGFPEWQKYDIIEGGVANDNVIDTVEDYENGRITAERALDELRFKKPNHQICITSQSIIDKYLRFENSFCLPQD